MALRLARSTVQRTLAALRQAGFLEWRRRTIEVDGGDRRPRREQTSNVYRFNLPTKAAQVVRQLVARRFGSRGEVRSARIVTAAELATRCAQALGEGKLAAGQHMPVEHAGDVGRAHLRPAAALLGEPPGGDVGERGGADRRGAGRLAVTVSASASLPAMAL